MIKSVVLIGLALGVGVAQADAGASLRFDPRQVAVRTQGSPDEGEFLVDTSGVHAENDPAVAFDGTDFLVVWTDERSGGYADIYGARVTPQGAVLDPRGFCISQAAYDQWSPALGFDGANSLVVWQDFRSGSYFDIYGARVTPQGAVLDPQGFCISQAAYHQWSPALGFDGANSLVVWADWRSGTDYDIYGARVSQAGTVLDPTGIPISTAANWQGVPVVSFDGANFLVVWRDERSGGYADIYGARVTPQGAVLDPQGFCISQAAHSQHVPDLGFDGANFLAVWMDDRSGSDWDIYGARVTPQGAVLDPNGIAVSTAANWQGVPVVSFDGTNFLVVWEDYRSGSGWDIYGTWVTPGGTVHDEGPVVRQEGNQWYPALARGSGSQTFLVYQGWAGTVGGKTYNTNRIWGKMDPSTGVEEAMNDERGTRNVGPTIVRGVLRAGDRRQETGYRAELLDASGRRVMELKPGASDVRHLSPGVYFVREEPSAVSRQPEATSIRRVVVAR